MTDPKPETVLPIIAVNAHKHRAFVAVQTAIIRLALAEPCVYPGMVPAEIVAKADAQGVKSNGWTVLKSLEIIEMLPKNYTNELHEIFGGRVCNKQPQAKGRWTAGYRLRNRGLAERWLRDNGQTVAVKEPEAKQEEMALT